MAATIQFPSRKSDEAHRTDEELIEILRLLLQDGEEITVRAVVRRMQTISQPSTITRDIWRMAQVTAHQTAQDHCLSVGGKVADTQEVALPETGSIAEWPEFRLLRCLIAAVRCGNLGQAARELGVSQPGITRQIRKLEGVLGTQLLVRHGRGVTPTVAGTHLFNRFDTVVHLLRLPRESDREPVPSLGTLSIALPPEVGLLIGGPFVEQVQRIWPNVKVEIHSGLSASLQGWILNGRVEIGVLPDPPTLDDFVDQPLVRESLGIVVGPRSPLADSTAPLRFRELTGLPRLLTAPELAARLNIPVNWLYVQIRQKRLLTDRQPTGAYLFEDTPAVLNAIRNLRNQTISHLDLRICQPHQGGHQHA